MSETGSAHKACGFVVTLWAHLRVNHMWGIAREWGTLSAFSAFRDEGRHQSLKSEIRKRSFRGGRKKRRSRLRGTTVDMDHAGILRMPDLNFTLIFDENDVFDHFLIFTPFLRLIFAVY